MRDRNQVVLPINIEICIPEGDYVFKVAEICESLDYTELFNTYLRAWRKVNPITMFEILVFAYMNRKFSSREIENLNNKISKRSSCGSHRRLVLPVRRKAL